MKNLLFIMCSLFLLSCNKGQDANSLYIEIAESEVFKKYMHVGEQMALLIANKEFDFEEKSKLTEKYEGQIDFCKDVIPEEFNSLRGGQEYFSLHCSHREMHKNLLLKFPEFKDLEKNQIKKVINAFYRDRQIPQPDKTYN